VPQDIAPQDTAPPAVTERAAAPAVTPPPRRNRTQAAGQPQPLTRNGPAAYAPPQNQPARRYQKPDNDGLPPATSDTVTVDGVNYVNGQEPRALGTLAGQPQPLSSDTGAPPFAPAMVPPPPPAYTTRPYIPTDHAGGAPLPNDVIILPSGQMALPNSAR